jgi:hypothetical protein
MADVTLETLQLMLQKVLDEQKRCDREFRAINRVFDRIDRALAGLKRNGA